MQLMQYLICVATRHEQAKEVHEDELRELRSRERKKNGRKNIILTYENEAALLKSVIDSVGGRPPCLKKHSYAAIATCAYIIRAKLANRNGIEGHEIIDKLVCHPEETIVYLNAFDELKNHDWIRLVEKRGVNFTDQPPYCWIQSGIELGDAFHKEMGATLDDGTVIQPANRIYMAATANTRGDGQGGDIYTATTIFNLASLNRFEKWEMSYPPAEVEEKILDNTFTGKLQANIMNAMVKTAADIRRAYLDGNCPGPISIRDLLRWGRKLIQAWNRKDVAPLYHSFDKAFGNGVDPHVRAMLHTLIQTNFGVPAPHIEGVSP